MWLLSPEKCILNSHLYTTFAAKSNPIRVKRRSQYKPLLGVSQVPKSVYSEPYQIFIQILRKEREATELSQEKLALKLGKPQSYVSKIELGERQINLVELQEWCDELEIPLIDFIQKWQDATKTGS